MHKHEKNSREKMHIRILSFNFSLKNKQTIYREKMISVRACQSKWSVFLVHHKIMTTAAIQCVICLWHNEICYANRINAYASCVFQWSWFSGLDFFLLLQMSYKNLVFFWQSHSFLLGIRLVSFIFRSANMSTRHCWVDAT